MSEDTTKTELGAEIKRLMSDKSLSMRKLSKLTGINAASLSRIINGKQPPGISHIIRLSEHLNVPMLKMLGLLGLEDDKILDEGMNCFIKTIKDMLSSFNIDTKTIADEIKGELEKYERYAKTDEGKRIIINEFVKKIDETGGSGTLIETLRQMYGLYCSNDIPEKEQAIIGGVLLYFIISTDIIPDNIFPIGYLDDAIAIKITADRLTHIIE